MQANAERVMATTLLESVMHYKKKLDKNPEDEIMLNVIHKLSKLPITAEVLEATHIGKSIRNLSKREDAVGNKAKILLKKWRDVFTSNLMKEKTASFQSNHKEKHEHKNSSYESEKHEKKHVDATNRVKENNSSKSDRSRYNSEVKQGSRSKYTHNDTYAKVREDCDPEFPELFFSASESVRKKTAVSETYEPSLKRKHSKASEENGAETGIKLPSKKLKYANDPISNSDSLKKKEQKHSLNEKCESQASSSHSVTVSGKKECPSSLKSDKDRGSKPKSSSDSKKITGKGSVDGSSGKTDKLKQTKKVPVHSSEEFTSSDVTFEDCLGLSDVVGFKTKKSSSSKPHKTLHSSEADKDRISKPKSSSDSKKITSKGSADSSSGKADKLKQTKKVPVNSSEEFTSSDVTFEDCLGLSDVVGFKTKKSSSSKPHKTLHSSEADKDRISKPKSSSDSKKITSKESADSSSGKADKLKQTKKVPVNSSEEFTSSNVTFEDCLGLNDVVDFKKKKSFSSKPHKTLQSSTTKKSSVKDIKKRVKKDISPSPKTKTIKESSHEDKETSKPLAPTKKKSEPDVASTTSTLPEIQPNYRPLPRNLDSHSKKNGGLSNEDATMFISSRKEKTAVYSGRKSCYLTEVPSLVNCCVRFLIDNIDALEYVGVLPYHLLKPVLEKCSPAQLMNIENFNPHLMDETNELWKVHCKRDYKLLLPLDHETWRDLYLRGSDERERRLKSITANISANISKSIPARQLKLVYVDSVAKPPRDVARRQAKHGTAVPASTPAKTVLKTESPSKTVPKPSTSAVHLPSTPVPSCSSSSSVERPFPPKKPKVAPLMAKTLKSMRQCFRR